MPDMHPKFKITNGVDFLNFLPADWRDDILPSWEDYSKSSIVYVLEDESHILAGGILFSTCSPDMLYNPHEAQKWYESGYLYIGFLYVAEKHRNKGLGSKWLHALQQKHPLQKYWLTVDEKSLIHFYERNGFQYVKSLKKNDGTEWLMTFEPQ